MTEETKRAVPRRKVGRPKKSESVAPVSSGADTEQTSSDCAPFGAEFASAMPHEAPSSLPSPVGSVVPNEGPVEAPTLPREPLTPAMQELRARMEEKAAESPPKGKCPYTWSFSRPAMVPMGYRNPATGEVDHDKIQEHIDRCWAIDTVPEIPGILIGKRKV